MPVKKLKPISNAQRFRVVNNFDMITASRPEKSLVYPKKGLVVETVKGE